MAWKMGWIRGKLLRMPLSPLLLRLLLLLLLRRMPSPEEKRVLRQVVRQVLRRRVPMRFRCGVSSSVVSWRQDRRKYHGNDLWNREGRQKLIRAFCLFDFCLFFLVQIFLL